MMDRQRTNHDWEGQHDDRDFVRDILPALRCVTLRRIVVASWLSKRFASQIRYGLAVPHRRHWKVLTGIGGQTSVSRTLTVEVT
jgi:hypothetical protein